MRPRHALALASALVLACVAAPLARGRAADLPEDRVRALVLRGEALLVRGQNESALRAVRPALHALVWSGRDYADQASMTDRAMVVAQTAIVRLRGRTSRELSPWDALRNAEAHLRGLAAGNEPLRRSRLAEALVALGDRMPEAHAILLVLHLHGELVEPEGYAALAVAARAIQDDDVAELAVARCARVAGSRARRVCPR